MICDEVNTFKEFVVDCTDLPPGKNAFIPGKCGGNFGNQDLKFRMLASRLELTCKCMRVERLSTLKITLLYFFSSLILRWVLYWADPLYKLYCCFCSLLCTLGVCPPVSTRWQGMLCFGVFAWCMGLEFSCMNIDRRCIFPCFGTISGKICSYRYECPWDLGVHLRRGCMSIFILVFSLEVFASYLNSYITKDDGIQLVSCGPPPVLIKGIIYGWPEGIIWCLGWMGRLYLFKGPSVPLSKGPSVPRI